MKKDQLEAVCADAQLLSGARIALALTLVFSSFGFATQSTAQQPPPRPSAPAAPQEPGSGSQLGTGTASDLDMDARLQKLLADHQYFRVQAQLSTLPPEQAQFYRGILANRSNQLEQSIQLLEPLVDRVTASGNAVHEKLLRKALAEDYLRHGDWAKAADAYQTLNDRLGAKLSPDEQAEIEMPLKMLTLARNSPPVTVDPCQPFRLQVSTDPLGLIDVPVFIDARSRSWMFDPTMPFNFIARSTAKEIGLIESTESVTISTLTGRPIQVHVAIVPRFTIGGRLTLHNVTVFVYGDADYYFKSSGYHVAGVLGYPALAAIGSFTYSDNTITIYPAKEIEADANSDLLTTGAPFFLDGDRVIVALGRSLDPAASSPAQNAASGSSDGNDDHMFVIDAGGQQSYLTSRYFDEHAADFNSQKTEPFTFPGQSLAPQPTYMAETVPLVVGDTAVDFHLMRVFTQPLGSAALDDVYGVFGIDALDQLKSYTFDYRTMRFGAEGQ
jgi:hypothetical protein